MGDGDDDEEGARVDPLNPLATPQLVNEQAISHTHPSEISRQGSHKAECVFLSRTTGSDVLELLVRKYCFDLRRSLSWTSY